MHGRKAFTLIELLVVVGIIGLLVSILVPSLTKAVGLGRRARCAANLRAVGVGFRMYLNDSDEIMPVASAMPSLALNDDPRICDVLEPYLGGAETLHCPADREKDFFASEGSSYQYHVSHGGRKVSDSFLTKRFGEAKTPVMYDYEPFHGPPGAPGSASYLFADMHVGDM
jgi:prepilin-type N-terminal cleavage/methylation domain-containing protein